MNPLSNMMNPLSMAIIATVIVSLISLVGILFTEGFMKKRMIYLVSFAAGTLMGVAFLDLIPEALTLSETALIFVLIGFILFYVLENFIFWYHCHRGNCEVHSFTYLSLVGDAVHNFFDGIIVVAAFIASVPLGIATTVAVIAHEIPQEIGDFAILVYGGFKKSTALFFNFLTALTAILGAIIGFFAANAFSGIDGPLIAIAAGGFIYIASADLIPEIHKQHQEDLIMHKHEPHIRFLLLQLTLFLAGVGMMALLQMIG